MTTGISLVRENAAAMRPPRMLWVPFPLGRPLGRAGDAEFQHRVIAHGLDLLHRPSGPVLEDYPEDMDEEVAEWLCEIVGHINLVQLGDARHSPVGEMNRCLLGKGCVPLRSILANLEENGYDGPLEVELIGEDVEPLSYEELLDHTRAYIDEALGPVGN